MREEQVEIYSKANTCNATSSFQDFFHYCLFNGK